MVRAGIPACHRTHIWYTYSAGFELRQTSGPGNGYGTVVGLSKQLKNENTEQIDKDLMRTGFSEADGMTPQRTEALRRLLVAYSARNPTVGYCQAMNSIGAMLLMNMSETNAYWVMVAIVEQIMVWPLPSSLRSFYIEGSASYYDENMFALHVDVRAFSDMVCALP